MKALFVAGGTGGHVYPALEVAREFKNSGANIYWIGKENSLEHEFSKREGFSFKPIKSSGFRKKSFIKKILSIFYLIISFIKSIYILLRIKPKFIFCFGGYLSLGPGLASAVLRVPLFIHEQNSVAGSANKLLANLATEVFEGFPNSFKRNLENINFVGNPVRHEITSFTDTNKTVSSTKKFKLLILGGSQGSTQLNSLVMDSLSEVIDKSNWEIVHQTGEADREELSHYYKDLKNRIKYEPLLTEVIDPNDKCNRLDRDELGKKQGILKTIFKGRPLPDLSLVQKTKCRTLKGDRHECSILAVNDGGHRSRTVLEFKLGLFRTSSDTYFISEKGNPQNIGDQW